MIVVEAETRKRMRVDRAVEGVQGAPTTRPPVRKVAAKPTSAATNPTAAPVRREAEPCVRAHQILFASAPGGGLRIVFF